METLSIKVSESEKARLQRLATERKTSLSALLREGLESAVAGNKRHSETSCYDLAAKYLEDESCLGDSGRGDLSTNRDHRVGFGS